MTSPVPDRTAQLVTASSVVVAAVALVLTPGWWSLVPTAVLLVVAAALTRDGGRDSTTLTAVCWGTVGLCSALSFGVVWPIPQFIGLVVAGGVLARRGWQLPAWFAAGAPDRPARLLAILSIPLTTIALVAFIASGRTDLESATEGLQSLPTWSLPLVGLGFVLVNPTVEEILFRGLLQTMVTDVSGRPAAGIATQAIAFGAIHLDGVPGGPLGVVMAAGWGAVLGIVRHRTGSIRLVWVVHVLANVAIYTAVVSLALADGVL